MNKLLIINYIKEISIIGMGVILIAGTLVINGTAGLGMNPALIIGLGIASIIIMLIVRFFDNGVVQGLLVGSEVHVASQSVGSQHLCVVSFLQGICTCFAQRVQFEDDEYYYYVKAVPKIKNKRKKRDW